MIESCDRISLILDTFSPLINRSSCSVNPGPGVGVGRYIIGVVIPELVHESVIVALLSFLLIGAEESQSVDTAE